MEPGYPSMGFPTDTSSPGLGWAEIFFRLFGVPHVFLHAGVETMFGGLYGLEHDEIRVQKSKLHKGPNSYTKVPEQKKAIKSYSTTPP